MALSVNPENNKSHNAEEPVENKEAGKSVKMTHRPYLGCFLAILASCIFGTSSSFVKVIQLDSFNLAMYRSIPVFLLALPIVMYNKFDILPKGKWFHDQKRNIIFQCEYFSGHTLHIFLRCLLGTGHLLANYYCLKHMSLGDTNMINSGSPAITVLLAWLLLKEKAGLLDILNIFIIVIGVILILKPPILFGNNDKYENDPEYIYAAISVSCSALFMANVFILLRLLKGNFSFIVVITFISLTSFTDVNYAVILMWFGASGILGGACSVTVFSKFDYPKGSLDILLVFLVGVMNFVGHSCFIAAAKMEKAAVVAIFRKATDIIVAFSIQILFFKVSASWKFTKQNSIQFLGYSWHF